MAGLAITFAALAPLSANLAAPTPLALASDKDKDKDEEKSNRDEEEDRVLNGQVLAIFDPAKGWSSVPGVTFDQSNPTGGFALRVAALGGITPVILYHPEQVLEWGLKLGDEVSLDGEYNGGTFYSNNFEITDRCCH
jgi:hypothetical protein